MVAQSRSGRACRCADELVSLLLAMRQARSCRRLGRPVELRSGEVSGRWAAQRWVSASGGYGELRHVAQCASQQVFVGPAGGQVQPEAAGALLDQRADFEQFAAQGVGLGAAQALGVILIFAPADNAVQALDDELLEVVANVRGMAPVAQAAGDAVGETDALIELAQGDETGIGRDLATVKIQADLAIIAEGEGGLHGALCIHGRDLPERLYGSLPGYSKVPAVSPPPSLCIGRVSFRAARAGMTVPFPAPTCTISVAPFQRI